MEIIMRTAAAHTNCNKDINSSGHQSRQLGKKKNEKENAAKRGKSLMRFPKIILKLATRRGKWAVLSIGWFGCPTDYKSRSTGTSSVSGGVDQSELSASN